MYPLGCPPSQLAHEGLGLEPQRLYKTCKNPDGDYYREGGQLNVSILKNSLMLSRFKMLMFTQ